MTQIAPLPVSMIDPGDNDRTVFDPDALAELAASIRQHGLAQPITVRMRGNRFQIVAGERRFRAISQVLGWDTVPCIVRQLDDEQASAIMLAENTGRRDLNPIEEARAYQARIERHAWDAEHIASVAGVPLERVKRRLNLLRLVPEAQHLVAAGQLAIGHAETLAPLDDNRQRIALRILASSEGLTLQQFRHIVADLLAEQNAETLFDLEKFWCDQVQRQELPRRGRHAFTGAPIRPDLPPVRQVGPGQNSTAALIDSYIADLLQAGLTAEAGVIGTLYTALVQLNYLGVPENSRLAALTLPAENV